MACCWEQGRKDRIKWNFAGLQPCNLSYVLEECWRSVVSKIFIIPSDCFIVHLFIFRDCIVQIVSQQTPERRSIWGSKNEGFFGHCKALVVWSKTEQLLITPIEAITQIARFLWGIIANTIKSSGTAICPFPLLLSPRLANALRGGTISLQVPAWAKPSGSGGAFFLFPRGSSVCLGLFFMF